MPSLCYPSTVKLFRPLFPHLLAATVVSSTLLLIAGCSSGMSPVTSTTPPVTTPPVTTPPVTTPPVTTPPVTTPPVTTPPVTTPPVTTPPVTTPPVTTPPVTTPPVTTPPVTTPPVTTPPVTTPPVTTPPVTTYSGVAFSGQVLAGATPIVGANIQVYATGTTGVASQATALLTTTLVTDSTGSFTVPAGYPCPTSSSLIYAVASGGVVGAAAANSDIVLLTPLGACNLIASPYVINEVTTAASAWALSQFLTAGANIAATTTNTQGITNAFATAANLANPATGISPGSTASSIDAASVAVQKIDSIANLLNTCTTSSATIGCSPLFLSVTPSGATAPLNTLDAALAIVHNPGNNVAALFKQSAASNAFSPALTAAPADWTLYINYTGGGMSKPTGLGVDSTGSIWVASYFNFASKFSPLGQPVFASGITNNGLNESWGLAIDSSDNAWITNESGATSQGAVSYPSTITLLNSAGQSLSGTGGFSSGGLNYPLAVAIDTNSTTWIVNYGNSRAILLSASGTPLSGAAGYDGPSLSFPVSVAIDANHNAWFGNQSDPGLTKISPAGTMTAYTAGGAGPVGLAFDQSGNLWTANYYSDSVSQFNTTTGTSTNSTGGGINHPEGIAVDGAGNVWVASFANPSISEIAGATSTSPGQVLSPAAGFASDAKSSDGEPVLVQTYAIAIDASGNLWATNSGSNTLTEFVGLAAPVKTPQIGPPQTP
jgi:streptogramin lyase